MASSLIDIPRTQKPEFPTPWWNSPEFHLNWIKRLENFHNIFDEILCWDKNALMAYASLIYSSKFSQRYMYTVEDFEHHLQVLTQWRNYQRLIKHIRSLIANSIRIEWESNYRTFDEIMLEAENFNISRYYSNIQEHRRTWKSLWQIRRNKLNADIRLAIGDVAHSLLWALPK